LGAGGAGVIVRLPDDLGQGDSIVNPPLTDVEVRILGALLAACNQTTNREPVMRLDENTATHHIIALRRAGLLRQIQPVGSRVAKFAHLLDDVLKLGPRELAVLGVLMLRGPQTPGELHARTARLASFADIPDLEAVLESLIARPEPLVARLPRRPGQKEVRYTHLLGGEPIQAESPEIADDPPPLPTRRADVEDERLAALERTVEALRAEVAAVRAELDTFRAQFG
jgi:uncharacterized protein YceH (UPF0502 family)